MDAERLGHDDLEVEEQEGQRLAVAVEIERVVDAAVEHVVEDEVHRLQLRQQEALHAMNFVLDDVLDGGVNDALNLDSHGKALSFLLLELPIRLPHALVGHLVGPG